MRAATKGFKIDYRVEVKPKKGNTYASWEDEHKEEYFGDDQDDKALARFKELTGMKTTAGV